MVNPRRSSAFVLRNYPSPIDGAPPGAQMGHREPTNLSVSRSRAAPNTLVFLGIQERETHSRSASKSMIKPDQTHCQEVSGTYVLQGTGYLPHRRVPRDQLVPTQHAKTWYINMVYQRDYYRDGSGIPR
jgi:hypothetical protein